MNTWWVCGPTGQEKTKSMEKSEERECSKYIVKKTYAEYIHICLFLFI